MKPQYTLIRRIYAWVGFLAILTSVILGVYIAKGGSDIECTVPNTNTRYEPILDVLEHSVETASASESLEKPIEIVKKAEVTATIEAMVTGYNTVPEQTDDTPCIAANGEYICDRFDTVACPSEYPFGSRFVIHGLVYECVDRTHSEHDDRFDINCNKDTSCPSEVTGRTLIHILTNN